MEFNCVVQLQIVQSFLHLQYLNLLSVQNVHKRLFTLYSFEHCQMQKSIKLLLLDASSL